MEASGHCHALVFLPLGKEFLVSIGWEAGHSGKEKNFYQYWELNTS
jgi:hypothetical protein